MGVRTMPYTEVEGKPQFAGMGSGGSGGGGGYTLPVASVSELGGIKVGNGLGITEEGVLSVGGINISTTEQKTSFKYLNNDVYCKVVENAPFDNATFWNTYLGTEKVIMAFGDIDISGDYHYFGICNIARSGETTKYALTFNGAAGHTGKLVIFYVK